MSKIPEPVSMVTCKDDVCTKPAQTGPSATGDPITDGSRLENISLTGPWPAPDKANSSSLWKDGPAVVLVIRRMGCPFCRKIFRDVSSRKAEFQSLNCNLVAISQQDIYAQDFLDEVWKGLPLYIDAADGFRRAMASGDYSLLWLCKPGFCAATCCGGLPKAGGFGDSNDKAKRRGGELVIGRGGGVRFEYHEDSDFGHASVDALLAAVRAAAPPQPPHL